MCVLRTAISALFGRLMCKLNVWECENWLYWYEGCCLPRFLEIIRGEHESESSWRWPPSWLYRLSGPCILSVTKEKKVAGFKDRCSECIQFLRRILGADGNIYGPTSSGKTGKRMSFSLACASPCLLEIVYSNFTKFCVLGTAIRIFSMFTFSAS